MGPMRPKALRHSVRGRSQWWRSGRIADALRRRAKANVQTQALQPAPTEADPTADMASVLARQTALTEELAGPAREPRKTLIEKAQAWVVVIGGVAAIIAFAPDIIVKVRSVFPEPAEVSGQVKIVGGYVIPVAAGMEPDWTPPDPTELPGKYGPTPQRKDGEVTLSVSTTGLKRRTALLRLQATCDRYRYQADEDLGIKWSPETDKETIVFTRPLRGGDIMPKGSPPTPFPAKCFLQVALYLLKSDEPNGQLVELDEKSMEISIAPTGARPGSHTAATSSPSPTK